jgi:hypothetical protein
MPLESRPIVPHHWSTTSSAATPRHTDVAAPRTPIQMPSHDPSPAADASQTSASASDVMHPTAIDGSASTPPSIQVIRHVVSSATSVHSNQDRTRTAGCGT